MIWQMRMAWDHVGVDADFLCSRGRGCNSKIILLPGRKWSQGIHAFINVADVQIGGSDYNLQVLAYNSLIMVLEMGANDREDWSLWDN